MRSIIGMMQRPRNCDAQLDIFQLAKVGAISRLYGLRVCEPRVVLQASNRSGIATQATALVKALDRRQLDVDQNIPHDRLALRCDHFKPCAVLNES